METVSGKKRLIVEVSPEQWDMIRQKMAQVGTTNFARYARKMLIDGYVFHLNHGDLKVVARELAAIGRNLNQIAQRANETRSVYAQDLEDVRKDFRNVKRAVTERLVKMAAEGEEAEHGVCEDPRDQGDSGQGAGLH